MKKFKSIGLSLLITLSFVLVIGIISSAAMMLIKNPEDYIALISGGAQFIYLIGTVVILRLRKVNLSEKCGISAAPFTAFLLPVGAAFFFSVFSSVIQEITPIPQFLTGEMTDSIGKSVIAYIAAIYIIAPITEELVFRGIIMTKLRSAIGAFPAVFISALLFGAIHLMTGSVITGIHALLGGLIFGLAYEKTGSLLAAIAAHLAGNLGGLIPSLIDGFEPIVQIIISIAAGIISAFLCIILIRKESKMHGNA